MGRPLTRPGLGSTTRRELCWYLAQGYSKDESCKRAGLPDGRRLHQFIRTREFADELRDAMRNHMQTNLSPKAVRILDEIMSDSKVMPKVRVDAAKCLLDRSGYSAGGKFVSETDHQKPIDEMTIEELEAFIRRPSMVIEHEENRRAAEAKLVPGAEDYLS